MTIEMITARGWQIWIDGKQPDENWYIGEGGHIGNAKDFTPIAIGDNKISRIRLLREDDEEIGFEDDWNDDNLPAKLYINDGDDGFWLPITFIVYGNGNNATPLKVTTLDGKSHDIDEVTTYIRAESEDSSAINLLRQVIGDNDIRTVMTTEEWNEQMDSMDDLELMVPVSTIKAILALVRRG